MGVSQVPRVEAAVREAVQQALDAADFTPTWALAVVGGRHPGSEAFRHLRSALGEIPIFGGAAPGVTTHEALSYSHYEVGVVLFDGPRPRAEVEAGLDQGERRAGERLGQRLVAGPLTDRPVLLLYDSVRSYPPPRLNVGSHLVDGLSATLPMGTHLWGAGMLGDLELSSSFLFAGDRVLPQGAVALVLEGRSVVTDIMHGCEPLGRPLRITSIDGPEVLELDGRRALDVILETTGWSLEEARDQMSLWMTLGAHRAGDDSPASDTSDLEGQYVNRLVLSFDEARGSVTLFEADFSPGTEVYIMHRDNESMLQSAKRQTERLARRAGEGIELYLYIDCAGRCQAFSGAEREEADIVRSALPGHTPFFGFYTGVEIAPVQQRSRPLDWTGVLTAIRRSD